MRVFRPDPRTGIVKIGQKVSRPAVIPLTRQLQEEIFLTENIEITQLTYTEPARITTDTEVEQNDFLAQQVKVTSPPKSKKNRRKSNKKLVSKT